MSLTKAELRAEVAAWAERIGVRPRELHLREMRRKWGSCSARGRVTLSLALLDEPAEQRDRVVVHELVHLKVGSHGRLFKALVRAHLEEGREERAECWTSDV